MCMVMNQIIKNKKIRNAVLFTIVGIAGGYAYYYFIGCAGGSCPITSNPWYSMAWGGLLGYLVSDLFNKKSPKAVDNKEKEE